MQNGRLRQEGGAGWGGAGRRGLRVAMGQADEVVRAGKVRRGEWGERWARPARRAPPVCAGGGRHASEEEARGGG